MKRLWNYIVVRLGEKTTQAAIIAGISSAAILTSPWSWIVSALCVVFALIPTKKKKPCEGSKGDE